MYDPDVWWLVTCAVALLILGGTMIFREYEKAAPRQVIIWTWAILSVLSAMFATVMWAVATTVNPL